MMKELDFLPRSIHQARRRRDLVRRNVLYSIGVAIALGCLHFVNETKLQSAQAGLTALQSRDRAKNLQRDRLKALRARKQALESRLELVSRLEDDAPLGAVIAEITRHMNDSMAIRSLVVETTPLEDVDPDQTEGRLDRGPTRVVLGGMAASDMQVGIFFGRLAECALFDDVNMSFSREARAAGRRMRAFELTFTVQPVALAW